MLIELLVVLAMLVVVVGATLTLLEVGGRAASRDSQFAHAIADAQAGLARMVHEIRQASSVSATTPNSIDFLVMIGGQSQRVFYECDVAQPGTSYNECVRLSVAAGGALPALSTGEPIVPRIVDGTPGDPVFSFSPNAIAPTYVAVKLAVPAAGELSAGRGLNHTTVLDAGAYLRNLDVGA
jgi:type II secretory pathway pseudopilin PulG